MITYEDLADWRLPNGVEMFYDYEDSFITTKETDRYLGIFGEAWFSVRLRKGQRWLHFVVAAQRRDSIRVELPRTAEEALVWMRMVVEMSGIKQERRK